MQGTKVGENEERVLAEIRSELGRMYAHSGSFRKNGK